MEIINSAVSTLAIILGGTFAYFKFIRGRVLCPNLALDVTAVPKTVAGVPALALAIRIANSGTVALSIPLHGQQELAISPTAGAVWGPDQQRYIQHPGLPSPLPPIRVMMVDGTLDADAYLEPGEVFLNSLLIQMPSEWEAAQLLLTVEVRARTLWARLARRLRLDRIGSNLVFSSCKVVTRADGG